MADKLSLSLTFLFAGYFLGVTLSQANQAGWGTWIDISHCTARPCNCSEKERVDNADQCKKGKVLQIRGCADDTCHYDKENKGPIRKEDCVNLNKFCPGWSEWKVKDECKCEGDSTTAEQDHVRTCTNPPPILELKGSKCIKNDDEDGLSDSEVFVCTCSEDDNDEDDSRETTTQPTTTPEIKYCKCRNATDGESDEYLDNGPDPSEFHHTPKPTTTTVAPDSDQYNQYDYGLDYSDYDDENLCLCNETMSNDNETMSYGSYVSTEASDETTVTLTYD